jgi:indolepyruvate ferredoxin oxidoreductase, beta subunit
MKETVNIIFYGIGGQGVLTASEICGWAALYEGFEVKKTEVHGMAQRGGSVESHLRFGKQVFSPVAPKGQVDFLMCLFAEEHGRFDHWLKPAGMDLFNFLSKAETAVGEHKKFINTFMLGALSHYLPIKHQCWSKAMETVLKKDLEENKNIFLKGTRVAEEKYNDL